MVLATGVWAGDSVAAAFKDSRLGGHLASDLWCFPSRGMFALVGVSGLKFAGP